MSENARVPHFLDTFSGGRLNLDDPRPDEIAIEDIAAALSKICRFGAQALTFFSVAQHAIFVHDLVLEEGRSDLALPALHHDSAEAYLGDIPTPVKQKLGLGQRPSGYWQLTRAVDTAIGQHFGYGWVNDRDDVALIKRADRRALLAEAEVLLHDAGRGVRAAWEAEGIDLDELGPLPSAPQPLDSPTAELRLLEAHSVALSSAI